MKAITNQEAGEELLRAIQAVNVPGVMPLTDDVISDVGPLTVCMHCRLDITVVLDPTEDTLRCPVCALRRTIQAYEMLLKVGALPR